MSTGCDYCNELSLGSRHTRRFADSIGMEFCFLIFFPPQAITEETPDDEILGIPGVGQKTLSKIKEIVATGKLGRLGYLITKETEAVALFMEIWGIGAATAEKLVAKGYRTIEDLRAHQDELTTSQKIGLRYFEEFQLRIPREEVEAVAQLVSRAAEKICPGLEVVACGSYRRGKKDCGDIDLLITHRDGVSHEGVCEVLHADLMRQGLLTDNLTMFEPEGTGTQSKYMGVCKLPDSSIHRRIDIIVVPFAEYACALLYFTGSGHFNRSMRLFANKRGMSLSQHSLNTGIFRDKRNEKINDGVPLPAATEEDVFRLLGLPYMPPNQRNK
eukprot:m.48900 g.48900  ORF g.48900 m.48900 type:complete len:329 (+) comp11429_c0_seq2:763-1749(+)